MISRLMRTLRPRYRLGEYRRKIFAFGLWGGHVYLFRRMRPGPRGRTFRLHPRGLMHPLVVRHRSSDADVLQQIFVDLEYSPLRGMSDVRLVVDCGANVGYSSAFFLSQFPSCHVVAIEPDPDNFAMLRRNLHEYGERVKVLRAGIWSHCVPLAVSRGLYGDGREWATQVRPCGPNEEAEIEGIDVGSLLASSGFDRISLLKIDIEGAEAVLFRENIDWLDKVDAIAIELHDNSQFGTASDVFQSAIDGRGFERSQSGELTICWRPGRVVGRT